MSPFLLFSQIFAISKEISRLKNLHLNLGEGFALHGGIATAQAEDGATCIIHFDGIAIFDADITDAGTGDDWESSINGVAFVDCAK